MIPVEPQDADVDVDVRPSSPPPSSQHRQGRWRTRGLIGVAAAVVIVGLIGALLSELSAGRIGRHPVARATATATASAPRPLGQWERVMSVPSGQIPLIAPSDPRVIYVLDYPHLRRTDDDGRTWHELATPTAIAPGASTSSGTFDAMISPIDPYTVFLLASFPSNGPTGAPCPASGTAQARANVGPGPRLASPPYSGPTCARQYYTTDGGQHWQVDQLPLPGVLGFSYGNGPSTVLEAQGSRLYDTITPPLQATQVSEGVRLVTSGDGGVTWQVADGRIAAEGGSILSYAAAPSRETVFAEVAERAGVHDLWRSDDAGASWTKVRPVPFARANLVAVVDSGDQQLLYADSASGLEGGLPASGPSPQAGILQVSLDGGQTWTASPAQGLPETQVADRIMAGVLADGSLVVPFMNSPFQQNPQPYSDVTYYAWKLGQTAWRQVAPAVPDGRGSAFVYPAGPWGPEALWGNSLNYDGQGGVTFTVWRCPLG